MKTISGPSSQTESGRVYWRGLDELAETPEFRQWLEREFPEGATEWTDGVSRRHFVKIMSASFLLAGVGLAGSGCRRPVEKILPFSKNPENYVHGVPQFYATAMPTQTGAVPLVVKSHEGRPIKVEGNSLHPDSNGGTDRFAQASILNLYDPDRSSRFCKGGFTTTPESAFDFLSSLRQQASSNGGRGLAFLLERRNSPSRRRLQALVTKQFPEAQWCEYEPVDLDIHRRAASLAFGAPVRPRFHFDKADVIVSLDCDFIGSEDDAQNHIRQFSARRQLNTEKDTPNRLYVAESAMSLTGLNADHRLRLPSSEVVRLSAALASAITKEGSGVAGAETLGQPAGVDPKWIQTCAQDLIAHKGRCIVVAGYRQPVAAHLLAHAMNVALGNIGRTVEFFATPEAKQADIGDLARSLNAGEVETLIILGGNPVYTAPTDLNWAATQRKAKTVVRLGYYEDETFPVCDWHLPAAHYLESWGDVETSDGTLVPIQPLVAPLFGGLTELEILARIAGLKVLDPYSLTRETFAARVQAGEWEAAWQRFLHDGFLANSGSKPVEVTLNSAAISEALGSLKPPMPGRESLEVVFLRDYKLDDGRYNNNGWLQELPDPITKIVWDNVVLMSRKTAREFGVSNSDVVEIKTGDRVARGPVWIQPGFADYSLGLALGYGRQKTGRVGQGTGFDAYKLRISEARSFYVGASLRPTGAKYPLSCTQSHWSMEGRPIIREANLAQYKEHPDFARSMAMHEPPVVAPLYPNPLDKVKESALHQWGMSIDLNKCVGCSACVLACQGENNVPIVGKDQVARGREMHWIRIDRYYTGRPVTKDASGKGRWDTFADDSHQYLEEWIDNPQVVAQPMLCQHCEAAPCENVCPVNATSHDHEGLNVMTYNRCVGTRYCSNNCPYKVRRFNFFDYNKRPLGELYWGPFGKRKEDEWDLIRLIKNPDVTVRMRGVMEKCTFCLQRIEQAKIAQKRKAGASGDVIVPDGTFTTACAQACPAGAIVFGNLKDPKSKVSQAKQLPRDYSVLEELLTKPRMTYLARVRNPNSEMPDFYEAPLSFREFEFKHGNPFQHGEAGHGNATSNAAVPSGEVAHPAGKGDH